MAMQAESPAVTPSAQVVGNAFVEQYYHILHQSPELVFRFYHDSSVLSRPDPDGFMSSVTTMQGINDRIISLNYKDYIAEIKTADAQQSFGEGVIVLVTGYLTGRDNLRKKFVQTFFLAPQEKGYFVLNDVFRYLEDNESAEVIPVSVNGVNEDVQAAPLAPEQDKPSLVPDHPGGEVPEPSVEEDLNNEPEVCDPSENEDGSITEEDVLEPPTHLNERECVTVTSPPSASQSQEDAPKQSYASILKAMKARPSPPPAKTPANSFKAKPPSNDQETVGSAKPVPAVEASASTSTNGPGKTNIVEAEGYSIYVRNLPQNATAGQLEEVFAKFGPIKQDGIQVRSNKQGFCFGFVEFESLSSMSSAIQASSIIIGNRKVVVEEKKTTTRVNAVDRKSVV